MKIIDTTLRDGEQSPGVVFTKQEKITLVKMLSEAGIDEIEVGMPSLNNLEFETISKIAKLKVRAKLLCWCRANTKDINSAKATGINRVHFAVPVSDIQLNAFNKFRSWALENLSRLILYTKKHFSFVLQIE